MARQLPSPATPIILTSGLNRKIPMKSRLLSGTEKNCTSFPPHGMANDECLFNEVPEHLRIASSDLHTAELIGLGISSFVKRATWLGCEVAVKELITHESQIFNAYPKQLEILMRLPHPHVVQLLGFNVEAEHRRAAIVMERLETNLEIVMINRTVMGELRSSPFGFYEVMDIATKIALGMRFLHSREVVHGSLSADIILMNVHTEGQLDIKIGGFAFSDHARNSGKPEDVLYYALICYAMLTGCEYRLMFAVEELKHEEIIRGMAAMELPAGISDDLAKLIVKCGDADPNNRPGFTEICYRLANIRATCDQALKQTTVTEDCAFQWTTHEDDEGNKCLEIASILETLPIHLSIDPADVEWRRPIGAAGGNNEVYEVNWLGCSFAVKRFKWLSPSFKDEVTFLTKLQYPHIARLIGVSVDDNGGWIMMERMDMDLRKLINSRSTSSPPFSGIEAQELCLKIALGLNFLHTKDVVHRDIKAANVLVHDHHGRFDVKITDFGSSHRIGNPNHVAHRAGTYLWRAPEVLRANRGELKEEQLKKTDVYCFAMTCYEIFTGHAPHEHLKERDVLEKRRPKLPAALHPELTILISKCWDDDPEVRPDFSTICHALTSVNVALPHSTDSGLGAWLRHFSQCFGLT